MSSVEKQFAAAKETYAALGVDVDKALAKLQSIPVSIHAWQGDDVIGFEDFTSALTGGCQVTGNYPGRARNADELRADLDVAMKLLPGTLKVGLQGHQVDKMFPGVDRDGFTIDNFSAWRDWAVARGIGMDIAPCYYSHPKLDHGFSLSHPDPAIREFWINHGIACRKIGEAFGKATGKACICNFWMPDGFKDTPADRYAYRQRMFDSLDKCFAYQADPKYLRDAVEPKLFGIGVESCTIGSNDFYLLYAQSHKKMMCFDTGHFHPTESIADKLSAIFSCGMDEVLLHVSRGVRWDSDHIIVLNDELLSLARESVAYDYVDKINFMLDFFDASVNRLAAWVVGARNLQKALLIGLLEPADAKQAEAKFDFTARLVAQETAKTLPWGAVWDYFCEKNNVPTDNNYLAVIRAYEKDVLLKR